MFLSRAFIGFTRASKSSTLFLFQFKFVEIFSIFLRYCAWIRIREFHLLQSFDCSSISVVFITANVVRLGVVSCVCFISACGGTFKFFQLTMLLRIAKIVLAIALSFTFTFSLWKIIISVHDKYFNEFDDVNTWLDENSFGQYRQIFRDLGEFLCYHIRDIITFAYP